MSGNTPEDFATPTGFHDDDDQGASRSGAASGFDASGFGDPVVAPAKKKGSSALLYAFGGAMVLLVAGAGYVLFKPAPHVVHKRPIPAAIHQAVSQAANPEAAGHQALASTPAAAAPPAEHAAALGAAALGAGALGASALPAGAAHQPTAPINPITGLPMGQAPVPVPQSPVSPSPALPGLPAAPAAPAVASTASLAPNGVAPIGVPPVAGPSAGNLSSTAQILGTPSGLPAGVQQPYSAQPGLPVPPTITAAGPAAATSAALSAVTDAAHLAPAPLGSPAGSPAPLGPEAAAPLAAPSAVGALPGDHPLVNPDSAHPGLTDHAQPAPASTAPAPGALGQFQDVLAPIDARVSKLETGMSSLRSDVDRLNGKVFGSKSSNSSSKEPSSKEPSSKKAASVAHERHERHERAKDSRRASDRDDFIFVAGSPAARAHAAHAAEDRDSSGTLPRGPVSHIVLEARQVPVHRAPMVRSAPTAAAVSAAPAFQCKTQAITDGQVWIRNDDGSFSSFGVGDSFAGGTIKEILRDRGVLVGSKWLCQN